MTRLDVTLILLSFWTSGVVVTAAIERGLLLGIARWPAGGASA